MPIKGAADSGYMKPGAALPDELLQRGVTLVEELPRDAAERLLQGISRLKAGVIGDACLDAYWHADMTRSELSRETPHFSLPVIREHYSPGAAGNVAANLRALGCAEVRICSVIGEDWRGHMLRQSFAKLGINDSHLLTADNWVTPAYCKPFRHGWQQVQQEDPRLDFNNHTPMRAETISLLIAQLDQMAEQVDIIAVTDQLACGVIVPVVRDRLSEWAARGKTIVVDSRNRIGNFSGVIVKPNEIEAQQWVKPAGDPTGGSWAEWLESARKLSLTVGAPCCLTLGGNGSLWVEGEHCFWAPSRRAEPPLDIVGAGDCFAAGLACALGAGSSGAEAMAFAHIGASIVVRKIGMTGTAAPAEIMNTFMRDA
ncbi:bifunctional heptose 7-phosphate kinase/heptose 1-phosphate adenyltransferase [Paenibacillus eucommiae]|uniref:RfaE bifunctional protein kinase chain/domain n=1 Tax=Paenibacillus eucommiae TaxID=1355755 RepID=A0ABS4J1J5_9BACL|nr:PfkB family carbohydrate kinase [Paenibacillus eucommiae]MBP1993693.1 rfaE bifunctional protein kinase chain/domain [Paenibacillus eucommiae]